MTFNIFPMRPRNHATHIGLLDMRLKKTTDVQSVPMTRHARNHASAPGRGRYTMPSTERCSDALSFMQHATRHKPVVHIVMTIDPRTRPNPALVHYTSFELWLYMFIKLCLPQFTHA